MTGSHMTAHTIEPAPFEPLHNASPPPPAKRHRPGRWLLAAVGLVFVLIMGFLLSARSLQITVDSVSPATVSVSGLAVPFGGRYLLRAGEHIVHASAQGYQSLSMTVTVDNRDSQNLQLTLQPLPGIVDLTVQPEGARVIIDGTDMGRAPLKQLPVAAGEHQLELRHPRYLPLLRPLTITGRNIVQQFELELAPAWADVTIDSSPAGADILIDGEAAGTTPATLEILQGEHQVILRSAGYADWQQSMELTAGQTLDLGTVQLQPAAGILALASVPAGANVTLDGEFQGQTPVTLELTPNQDHRLALFKPGYRRYSTTVQLPAAARDSQTIKLRPRLGEVRFNISPPDAELIIDGKVHGKGSQTLSLPAFPHRVEIRRDGFATVHRQVTPRPGLQQAVDITLQTEQQLRMARIKPEITTALGQTLLLFKPAESALHDFTMGASRREPGRRSNEVLHPVALRRMFYLQTTEVTNAQFRVFSASHNSGQVDGNSLNREHQPVVQVSWQQAASFCNWLSRREGLPPFYRESQGIITGFTPSATGYRLPTEAEWAWAARASGDTLLKFPWGDRFPPEKAIENYADNTSAHVTGRILNGYTDGFVVSADVGSFPPNQNGLFDLGGNVAEWVHDVYGIPSANGATATDPMGPQNGDNYVIRGASWAQSKISELRLSHRDYGQAGRDDVGFRLARYAE